MKRLWTALLVCAFNAGCGGGEPLADGATQRDLGRRNSPGADLAIDGAIAPDLFVQNDAAPVDGGSADLMPDDGFHYFALNHILSTGQSLSVGAVGAPPLSTVQPYENRTFNTGVLSGGTNLTGFIPLVEAGVETMSSGMANLITKMARTELLVNLPAPFNSHDLIVSCHGIGGVPYAGLKKGGYTQSYANGMAQAAAAMMVSALIGRTYVVRAVTTVHGESDHAAQNANYDKDLLEWQANYEADVKALTGQREPIPMFQSQISSWTRYGQAVSIIPQLQALAAEQRPDKIVLVMPKYFLSYVNDGVHLDNAGYRWMGEYYAKAYRKVVLEGKRWLPLRPRTVTRNGAEISIAFDVPVPPLVLDTVRIKDPGNFGFEYWDDSGSPPAITAVVLDGQAGVKVTLAKTPGGNTRRLRYAYTAQPGVLAGPMTGPRGCLRDSDATASPNNNALFNWAIHFDVPVN